MSTVTYGAFTASSLHGAPLLPTFFAVGLSQTLLDIHPHTKTLGQTELKTCLHSAPF